MAQTDLESQGEPQMGSTYSALADKVLSSVQSTSPSIDDMNSVVAAMVQKLQAERPGAPTEALFDEARSLYWKYQDIERAKKKKSGMDEMSCDSPCEICD